MCPKCGDRGGTVVAAGPPEKIARTRASHTGRYIKAVLPRPTRRAAAATASR